MLIGRSTLFLFSNDIKKYLWSLISDHIRIQTIKNLTWITFSGQWGHKNSGQPSRVCLSIIHMLLQEHIVNKSVNNVFRRNSWRETKRNLDCFSFIEKEFPFTLKSLTTKHEYSQVAEKYKLVSNWWIESPHLGLYVFYDWRF